MNKFILLMAISGLSMLSSCGSSVQAQNTVPAVTFETVPASSDIVTATTASATITTTTTVTAKSADVPKIIKTNDLRYLNKNKIPDKHSIDVEQIYQEPELPAGCEITSLTMLLNYLGFDIDKVELCDKYLKKNYDYTENFSEAFVGNPKNGTGFGCYAPVIDKTAQKYLTDMKSDLNVYDLSGTKFSDLFSYIADDKPVVIWASMGLVDVRYYNVWTMEDDGEEVWWYENEHCMLLTGYDIKSGTVTVCDPLKGEYTYDMSRFEEIYDELEQQAVTIF